MILFFEIALIVVCILIINSFVIYPIVIHFIAKRKIELRLPDIEPGVSIIIAARNEEKVIAGRIKNIAEQNYDLNKLEVFIGSDNSDDTTNQILLEMQKEYTWLNVVLFEKRQGKAGILNELVKKVNNEILVFTDANTEFQKNTLKNLVRDFQKDEIGGVCGKLVLIKDEKSLKEGVEEASYWQYETIIKRAEGKSGILLSANGGIFAIRKELYKEIPVAKPVTDDLFISLSVVSQNRKFSYAEDAIAFENTGKDIESEYKRKVRFGATNFQTLIFYRNLLSLRNPFLTYAFFSHKVTRWFLPALLLFVLVLSIFLSGESILIGKFFAVQIVFLLMALAGYLLSLIKIRIQIFSLPYFFVLSNAAIAEGFLKFLRKEHSVIWNSTER